MKDYEAFKKRVSKLCKKETSSEENVIRSKNCKKKYLLIKVEDDKLHFRRLNGKKKEKEKLDLKKLYNFYKNASYYDTVIAKDKKYKLGGLQSPSVAVILALINIRKMDFETFKKKVKSLDVAYSIGNKKNENRIKYSCSVNEEETLVTAVRETTGNSVDINLSELYEFYVKENCYKTPIAKKYVPVYMRSPAVAILHTLLTQNQDK